MTVTLSNAGDYTSVWFPTWSIANGQDDIVWHQARKQSSGDWTVTVDLTKHQSIGSYAIHVYGSNGGAKTLLTDTTAYVERLAAPVATAVVSDDCSTMTVTLSNAGDYTAVWFPIWSVDNGQDDIVWYRAQKQSNGDWTVTADLTQHRSAGFYAIHVYGEQGASMNFLTQTGAVVGN